MDKVQELALRN